jgi:peroxiredoxin Q/BCP
MIGQKAPEFSLQGDEGKSYTLKECKGKSVVLVFYCMNDTPG